YFSSHSVINPTVYTHLQSKELTLTTKTQTRPGRQSRQQVRQQAMTEAVMAEGAVRIEDLAERFEISIMTVHRDLDELESRGLLRKERGIATATSTALVESSDVYRSGQNLSAKQGIAREALKFIDHGQAIILDDSTTTLQLVPYLREKTPLTVITNTLTIMEELKGTKGIDLVCLGGQFHDWCSAFLGRMTQDSLKTLRTDLCIMSTSAITDDIAFHQNHEIVDVKRTMFESAQKRILLVDHSKFDKRALYMMLPLSRFDAVIVDEATDQRDIDRLRENGTNVVIASHTSQALS